MQAQQLQALVASTEAFAGIIAQTLSADNAARRAAEDAYTQLRRQLPDAVATHLLQLMRASGDANVRATCAVYLRKFLKPGPKEAGWEQLNRNTKTLLRRELLAALAAEPDRAAAKAGAAVVVELGGALLAGKAGWPELQPALGAALGASSAVTREAALQVVAGLASELRAHTAALAPALSACLAPQSEPALQLAALKAVEAFLEVLRKPRELRPLQPCLAGGLEALQSALAAGREEEAEEMLVVLIRTAELEPGLWQPHVRLAVPGMLALAGPGGGPGGAPQPDDLRKLAAEWVLSLVEAQPAMVQAELGAGPLASQLLGCLAHFVAGGVEEAAGWGADPMAPPAMDEDDTLGDLHRHGLECALRAAESLDGRAVLGGAVAMSAAWARDGGDWRRRHAVLLCLSQVVGAVKEVVGPAELTSLAGLLAEGLADPHPRVRWAACHAGGVLSDELGPRLQLAPPGPDGSGGGGGALAAGLVGVVAEAEGPGCPQRVKAQAASALLGFMAGLQRPDADAPHAAPDDLAAAAAGLLGPLLPALLPPLLAAVEACAAGGGGVRAGGRALIPTPLQEYSLDVLTHLAVTLRSHFAPVFPAAMPRVLGVLGRAAAFHAPHALASGAVTEEEAAAIVRVQVGALECAAFMCRAAGPAAAAEHAGALAGLLAPLARPDLEPSSRLLVPLLNAVEPLAAALGPAAGPVAAAALPLLAQWAAVDVGLEIDLEEEEDDAEGSASASASSDRDDSDVAALTYGGADFRASASRLAAKAAAASALEELVAKMGPALAPHAAAVAEALVPCMLDYPLGEVHAIARRAVPPLLRHYAAALAAGDPAASPAAAAALLGGAWRAAVGVLHPEAGAAEGLALGAGAGKPTPTVATRADMVQLVCSLLEACEPAMLGQAQVAAAMEGMKVALAAAQTEEEADGAEDSDGEADDKSMESDGSEDVGESEDEEEEGEEAEGEEDEESAAAARERLRQQVSSAVGALSRKYGDAVGALGGALLAAAAPGAQVGSLVAVHGGRVA